MIEKSAGIIIEDNKVLLVSGNSNLFFWLPGGKLEKGETPEDALKRELKEELDIELSYFKPYITYVSDQEEDGTIRKVYTFIIKYDGRINNQAEIDRIVWLSKEDFSKETIPLQSGVKIHLVPQLIKDGLLFSTHD